MENTREWLNDAFWDRVDVRGPDECWEYRRSAGGNRGRYGHVRIWYQGQRDYAHRVAFRLAGGIIKNGTVCHEPCDNAPCCNPRHLLDATPQENVRQRDERGRRTPFLPTGSSHWSAKLTDPEVQAVRKARALGLPAETVASLFSVSRSSLYNVWGNVHYPVRGQADGVLVPAP